MTDETTGTYIVKSRSDGRGGIRPFGLKAELSKSFIGKTVNIGGKNLKVTTDGRVNIPKKIMNEFGITGKDGRKRVSITFTSQTGRDKKQTFAGFVNKPLSKDKNRSNGWRTLSPRKNTKRGLKPSDGRDYNWSHE